MIGGIRETNFHQVLPSFPISVSGGTVGLVAGSIQQGLVFMPMNRATVGGGAGALGAERAGGADGFG